MHQREAARRLVDVHDSLFADTIGAHEPAQHNEEPVRVGVLLLRAVELSHALGGLLATQAHATQELLHPAMAGTGVESLCVESCTKPLIATALTHRTSVTRKMCSLSRVMSAGESKALLSVLLLVRSVSSGRECSG